MRTIRIIANGKLASIRRESEQFRATKEGAGAGDPTPLEKVVRGRDRPTPLLIHIPRFCTQDGLFTGVGGIFLGGVGEKKGKCVGGEDMVL